MHQARDNQAKHGQLAESSRACLILKEPLMHVTEHVARGLLTVLGYSGVCPFSCR